MGRKRGSADSQATIGEMMFARSVLEEKNELIDQKDTAIRELASKLRGAEREREELLAALNHLKREDEDIRADERQKVIVRMISDVVGEISATEPTGTSSIEGELAMRIVDLLCSQYGLRPIDEEPEHIDPRLHHVVDVDHSESSKGRIEILSPGYRIGDSVLRPALVKVALGVRTAGGRPTYGVPGVVSEGADE